MAGPISAAVRHSSNSSNSTAVSHPQNQNVVVDRTVQVSSVPQFTAPPIQDIPLHYSVPVPIYRPASPTMSALSGSTSYSRQDLKYSTRRRKRFAIFTSFCFFVAVIFLILVNIGNVSNESALDKMFMFKIDVSHIIAGTNENYQLLNSIAQSIGLHDFYQVGMWNYCAGYNLQGVTTCSKPQFFYWFNPVQILLDELFAGATITLPADIINYLHIIKVASQVMFGCFFVSTITSFVAIFLAPLSIYSRYIAIPISLFCLLSAIATVIGAGISTAEWKIFSNVITNDASTLNIIPTVGLRIFVFEWIAAGAAIVGAIGQLALTCCGTSRRDIRIGRRAVKTNHKLNEKTVVDSDDARAKRRWWGSMSHRR